MSWKYALKKVTHFRGELELEEDYWEIIEVYYDNDGKLIGSSNSVGAHGNTLEDVKESLLRMLDAVDKAEYLVTTADSLELRSDKK